MIRAAARAFTGLCLGAALAFTFIYGALLASTTQATHAAPDTKIFTGKMHPEGQLFIFLYPTIAADGGTDLHHITAGDYSTCIVGAILESHRLGLPEIWCDPTDADSLAALLLELATPPAVLAAAMAASQDQSPPKRNQP